jgi:hypothetical protein
VTGQDDINQFAKEVVHILAIQLSLNSDGVTARRNTTFGLIPENVALFPELEINYDM